MKKRINLLYMIMALVTIVASVSIACTVFYNVLKHEVLEDMHNYIDVFIGADAWGMVTDPDNIVEQKVIDNYDGNLRITFINSQGYAVVDTLVDIDKMENLGIYEVAPEDFALCEFVDTSKIEIQKIVRQGLDLLYKEMN